MAEVIWTCAQCEYDNQGGNQVLVTQLHWRADLNEDEYHAGSYGVTPDDGNRVYALPALEAVPANVIVGWIQAALGDEEVERIEQGLRDGIAEKKEPTSGGFVPS